jgi:hypothetical protein
MKNLLFCLAALLLLSTCTKPDPLPPATEVGAQTFGCYVDGRPFVPSPTKGVLNAYPPIESYYEHLLGGKYLYITATSNDGRGFLFYIKDAIKPGRYEVDQDARPMTQDAYTPGYIQYMEPGNGYVTNARHTGWLNLTRCDTTLGIFSGTFEFRAYSNTSKTSVQVTDGRFDLDYRKQRR